VIYSFTFYQNHVLPNCTDTTFENHNGRLNFGIVDGIQLSLQIGQIKGIGIKLHFTLVIAFGLLVWTISTYFMPQYVQDLSQTDYWFLGIVSTVLLFFAILLHELSHSLMSQRYGIPVRSITLFIFGGISDISREPKSVHKEFTIAIIGPITSFLIAGIFAVLLVLLRDSEFISIENASLTKTEAIMFYGFLINILLGIFNMIPAFPLDGGRILRSVLVKITGNFFRATKISTTIGVLFSYLFMGFGAISLFSGNTIGGIWMLIIGWFLNNGVKSYQYYFELQHLLQNVKAKEVMKTPIVTIKSSLTIEKALEYFRTHLKSELPVVDENNEILLGMLTNGEVLNIEEVQRSKVNVKDVMIPKSNLIIFSSDTKMDDALMEMVKKRQGKVFVCDKQDRLLGIISKTDLLTIASERQEYYKNTLKRK
jgi:Zn-dependent protease/CBS domain-containing protein